MVGLETAQKEAVRGFTKTIDGPRVPAGDQHPRQNGAVIQVSTDLRALDPIVGKAEVFAQIKQLLDEAKTHLLAGGMAFPFSLGSGFAGFDTPATFLQANRAIKARVDVYTGDNAGALAALGESFLSADAMAPNLDLGIFHAFGTGPGDQTNPLNDPNLFVHPSVRAGAEMQANGGIDLRVARKVDHAGGPGRCGG